MPQVVSDCLDRGQPGLRATAYREDMRTLVVLLLLAGTAYAQAPGDTPPGAQFDPLYVREVDSPVPPPKKSLASAYLVTIASTSIPVALSALSAPGDGQEATGVQTAIGIVGIAGMVLGPSAGHWYVGEGVTTGLTLRVAGVAGIAAIAMGDPHMNHLGVWIVGGLASVGVYEAGFIWDLVTLPRSVRRYNQQHRLQLAPMAGQGTTGLSLAGTF
jgi:hypothetical protein